MTVLNLMRKSENSGCRKDLQCCLNSTGCPKIVYPFERLLRRSHGFKNFLFQFMSRMRSQLRFCDLTCPNLVCIHRVIYLDRLNL